MKYTTFTCRYLPPVLLVCAALNGCTDNGGNRSVEEKGETTTVAENNANDITAIIEKAVALNRMGDYAGAARRIEQAVAADPRSAPARRVRGRVMDNCGKFDAADEDFTKAAALTEAQGGLLVDWGRMLVHAGKAEAALKQFRKALALPGRHRLRALVEIPVARGCLGKPAPDDAEFKPVMTEIRKTDYFTPLDTVCVLDLLFFLKSVERRENYMEIFGALADRGAKPPAFAACRSNLAAYIKGEPDPFKEIEERDRSLFPGLEIPE